jgi:hypothetical protein
MPPGRVAFNADRSEVKGRASSIAPDRPSKVELPTAKLGMHTDPAVNRMYHGQSTPRKLKRALHGRRNGNASGRACTDIH